MSLTSLVVVDSHEGSLHRYEVGGNEPRLTHSAESPGGGPVEFTAEIVEQFRTTPHPDFYVGADPNPPGSPDGGTPMLARAPIAA